MSFLSPWFLLAGIALTAIPIAIHLFNRRRYKIVDWAAMHYLLAAMKRNRRRLQFESLLLLATRCLLLLLAGAALARPLGCDNASIAALAGNRAGLHVLIVDDSYSMAYEQQRGDARTHFEHAKILARQLIDRLDSGSQQVAVITASQPARVLVKSTYNIDAAVQAIASLKQASSGTDLAESLRLAEQIATENASQPSRNLHIITDCTAGALRDNPVLATLGKSVAASYRIGVYSLGSAGQSNQSVGAISASDALVRVGFGTDLLASINGYGNVSPVRLSWKMSDQSLPGAGDVRGEPAGVTVTQSQGLFEAAGPATVEARLASADRLPIDDARQSIIPITGEIKLLIVEGRRGMNALDGSAAFMRLALSPPTETKGSRYIVPEVISDLELPGRALGDYRAVIFAGVGAIAPESVGALKAYTQSGGSLLIFMGDPVNADSYNRTLGTAGLLPGALVARVDAPAGDRGFVFDFDPGNPGPLLSAFRNVEKSGLETTQVYSYWRVQPDESARAVVGLKLRGATPDPMILTQSVGAGRVVFVATSADAEWSTLVAKRSAYVTLLHELVGFAVAGNDGWMNRTVGQRLELPASMTFTAAPVLVDPQKKSAPLARTQAGVWTSDPLPQPGLWSLEIGSTRLPVAVGLPAREADVRVLEAGEVRAALGDVDVQMFGDQIPDATGTAAGSTPDFSWPLLLLVLPLLFAESTLAQRFGRGRGQA